MNGLAVYAIIVLILHSIFFNRSLVKIYLFCVGVYIVLSFVFVPFSAWKFNSGRRKFMISTWGESTSPKILGTITTHLSSTLSLLSEVSETVGFPITLNHLTIKAIGETFKNFPDVSGMHVFGGFVPSSTINVTCAVEVEGRDPEFIYIQDVESKSLIQIAKEYNDLAEKAKKRPSSNMIYKKVPAAFAGILSEVLTYLSCAMGINLSIFGAPKNQSLALIHDLSSHNVDVSYSPFQSDLRAPIIANIGTAKDLPIAVDGNVVVEKVCNFMITLDHRFVDGGRGSKAQNMFKDIVEDPKKFFDIFS